MENTASVINIIVGIIGIGTIVYHAGRITEMIEVLKAGHEDHEIRVRKLEKHTYTCGAKRKAMQ